MADKHSISYYRYLLKDIKFGEYVFNVVEDQSFAYLQASYMDRDIVTGELEMQFTRKWQLSPFMTKSEFVQTVFKCVLTSAEHRTREHFRYKGIAVFGPHFDVEELVALGRAGAHDYREPA